MGLYWKSSDGGGKHPWQTGGRGEGAPQEAAMALATWGVLAGELRGRLLLGLADPAHRDPERVCSPAWNWANPRDETPDLSGSRAKSINFFLKL